MCNLYDWQIKLDSLGPRLFDEFVKQEPMKAKALVKRRFRTLISAEKLGKSLTL